MTEYDVIVTEQRHRVGYITLHRPEALNALNRALVAEISHAAQQFDRDPESGAIVLTGSPKAFAAGADIKEMATQGFADMYLDDPFAELEVIETLRTPVIAAVAGFALGG